MEALRFQITTHFTGQQAIHNDEELMNIATSLCQLYDLTAEDLVTKWETFSLNHGYSKPTIETFTLFQKHLSKSKSKSKIGQKSIEKLPILERGDSLFASSLSNDMAPTRTPVFQSDTIKSEVDVMGADLLSTFGITVPSPNKNDKGIGIGIKKETHHHSNDINMINAAMDNNSAMDVEVFNNHNVTTPSRLPPSSSFLTPTTPSTSHSTSTVNFAVPSPIPMKGLNSSPAPSSKTPGSSLFTYLPNLQPAAPVELPKPRTHYAVIDPIVGEDLYSPEDEFASDLPSTSTTISNSAIPTTNTDSSSLFAFLHESALKLSASLSNRVMTLSDAIFASEEDLAQPVPVGTISQDSVLYAGRICSEGSGEGRLNEKSVILEGDRESNGETVRLDLTSASSFALFPGQIILAAGRNPIGGQMNVSRVYTGTKPTSSTSAPDIISKYQTRLMSRSGTSLNPLSVIVAAGPFTSSSDLNFEGLAALRSVINTKRPDVVFLCGPFLDSSHTSLTTSMKSVYDIFIDSVLQPIISLAIENPSVRFTLISSAEDSFMIPSVLPTPSITVASTPSFTSRVKELTKSLPNIQFAMNPSVIEINEIKFGLSSHDVLLDLGSQEISRSPSISDRLTRLTAHCIDQQSFYPIYPAAKPKVPLDMANSHFLSISGRIPDVLITPSKLIHFVKQLPNQILAINPGLTSKGSKLGTFAHLTIHPLALADLESGRSQIHHKVASRTRVDIIKL